MQDLFHPYANLFAAEPKGPGDARPTALQVIRDLDLVGKMAGKVALVTGATSGIGIETARALHATGADVFITARDLTKAQPILEDIRKTSEGHGNLEVLEMEALSLDSVKKAAKAFLQKSDKLNILVNNAG
jgi:NAD(P)-dependent dehydrogenase (short-subunit alcohol dehydrogenase family)